MADIWFNRPQGTFSGVSYCSINKEVREKPLHKPIAYTKPLLSNHMYETDLHNPLILVCNTKLALGLSNPSILFTAILSFSHYKDRLSIFLMYA